MAARPLARKDLDHILNSTRSLWQEVRGQRLFVTGGTGFFGCWLVESFCHINRELDLGAQMVILSRTPAAFKAKLPHIASDSAISLLEGDVRDFTFPGGEFRYVIHAATAASAMQAKEAPLEMLTTILTGTQRTLDFAASHGAKKFLLTSSGAVYGKQPAALTHVAETYAGAPNPLDAESVYAEGKRVSELMCAIYQKVLSRKPGAVQGNVPLEFKIARCWAFCGPHLPLDAHFAIGNFIGDVLAGRPIHIRGDGTPRRSYLYASDLAIWLWTILFRGPNLIPLNVGSAHDLSILELAQLVVQTLSSKSEILVAKRPTKGTKIARYVPSVDRAAELLGLGETVNLQDAILRTVAWHGRSATDTLI